MVLFNRRLNCMNEYLKVELQYIGCAIKEVCQCERVYVKVFVL